MSTRKPTIPLLAVGICASIYSAASLSTDLLSSYQLALENDRTFSAARNQFEAVKQTQRQAKGLYYPKLSVVLEHTETEQVINRSENEVFGQGVSDFPTDDLTLSLQQPLFRWDFINERKIAKAEVHEAEYQFIAAEQELMLRTAEAYLLALAASDNDFVTNAELAAVEQQLKLAEKRLDVGLASPTEVHESQARYQLNQAEAIESSNSVIDRSEGLRTITGEAPGALMPLAEQFDMVPPDPADPELWIDRAMASNLAVRAREAALEVAEAEYMRQKAGRYPTLDLVANFNNRDTGGSLFGGGSDVDTDDIVLRADWTVFQGGVLRARIKEALYNKQRAEDDLELQRNTVRRDTRNAYLGVVSNIAKSNALKASLDAQQMTVEAKQKGFETGSASNIEVLDAKRDFFFVQRDYLKARYDYLLSLLNLKRQVGSLSPEDLTKINGMLNTASVQSVSELELARNIQLPETVTAIGVETGTEFDTATLLPPAEQETGLQDIAESNPEQSPAATAIISGENIVTVSVAEQQETTAKELADSSANTSISVSERRMIAGHNWLFQQGGSQYSLQLASLESESDATDFIISNNIGGAHYFKSNSKGKTWYYVLTGNYDSEAKAAQAAAEEGFYDAWIRKFDDVKSGRCSSISVQTETVADILTELCNGAAIAVEQDEVAPAGTSKTAMIAPPISSHV